MITIPNPCSENWNKMSKTEKGRFCNSCNKVVIDFSKMKNEKIESYFQMNQNENICGNFKNSQINSTTNTKHRFKLVALFIVFVSFIVTSCKTKGLVHDANFQKNPVNNNPVNRTKEPPKYVKPAEKIEIINDSIKK
ncbi:hypothetical protein [Flavobacterium sp.]|uniref:hypothetical protein n=1 Tax=Flavobacterium sp. TaxID=239 RepID=UPI00286AAFFC|nr:hypothetical protein [Flavobacterium sp.]